MKKALILMISLLLLQTMLLTGCAAGVQDDSRTADTGSEHDIAAVVELLGKMDDETADFLGGGAENWTEDKSVYIGRIFEAELYGEQTTIYTSCDASNVVSAVSVWITDGSSEVTEELLQSWQQKITKFSGREMAAGGTSVESGSQSWEWRTDDTFYTLRLLDNTLTLGINPAVGELK